MEVVSEHGEVLSESGLRRQVLTGASTEGVSSAHHHCLLEGLFERRAARHIAEEVEYLSDLPGDLIESAYYDPSCKQSGRKEGFKWGFNYLLYPVIYLRDLPTP